MATLIAAEYKQFEDIKHADENGVEQEHLRKANNERLRREEEERRKRNQARRQKK